MNRKIWPLLMAIFLWCETYAMAVNPVMPEVPRISAHEAYKKFIKGDIIIVDAMGARTYEKYHILGAVSLPNDGEADLRAIREMALPFKLDQEIIVYCD